MGTSLQLDGCAVWGFVLELGRGLRLRLAVDDWERLSLNPGQRIPVKLPNRSGDTLFVEDVVEIPPVIWIMLTNRVCNLRVMPAITPTDREGKKVGKTRRVQGIHALSGDYIVSFPRVVERLHHLVFRDHRITNLGIGGLARVAFHEVCGRVPTPGEMCEVIQDFWEYWHEQHDRPQPAQWTRAGSSRQCIVEEISPSQENAIRALEDADLECNVW